jgi:hypothetical protein
LEGMTRVWEEHGNPCKIQQTVPSTGTRFDGGSWFEGVGSAVDLDTATLQSIVGWGGTAGEVTGERRMWWWCSRQEVATRVFSWILEFVLVLTFPKFTHFNIMRYWSSCLVQLTTTIWVFCYDIVSSIKGTQLLFLIVFCSNFSIETQNFLFRSFDSHDWSFVNRVILDLLQSIRLLLRCLIACRIGVTENRYLHAEVGYFILFDLLFYLSSCHTIVLYSNRYINKYSVNVKIDTCTDYCIVIAQEIIHPLRSNLDIFRAITHWLCEGFLECNKP